MASEKRLIDSNALSSIAFQIKQSGKGIRCVVDLNDVDDIPTVDAIPISVMKSEIIGINAADQCDQAGRYDFELREALKTVLRWYETPRYKEHETMTP